MDLKGKRAIVTGGANGIGRCLVERLVDEGVHVGVFDIDVEGLERLGNVYSVYCDVDDVQEVRKAVDGFHDRFGGIDILVNNAALVCSSPLIGLGMKKHDVGLWDRVIATDLSAVFYVTVHVVQKMMLDRIKGVVVNVSSICAAGNAGQSAYSAAKAGVEALTVVWAKELCAFGIRVVGIAPGFIETDTTLGSVSEGTLRKLLKRVPLKRLGQPDEVVESILFVIENDFFNGRILRLDGGLRV